MGYTGRSAPRLLINRDPAGTCDDLRLGLLKLGFIGFGGLRVQGYRVCVLGGWGFRGFEGLGL